MHAASLVNNTGHRVVLYSDAGLADGYPSGYAGPLGITYNHDVSMHT